MGSILIKESVDPLFEGYYWLPWILHAIRYRLSISGTSCLISITEQVRI